MFKTLTPEPVVILRSVPMDPSAPFTIPPFTLEQMIMLLYLTIFCVLFCTIIPFCNFLDWATDQIWNYFAARRQQRRKYSLLQDVK